MSHVDKPVNEPLYADGSSLFGYINNVLVAGEDDIVGDTFNSFVEQTWIGIPGILEFRLRPNAISFDIAILLKVIAALGNISMITDLDDDLLANEIDSYYVYFPWLDVKIGGQLLYIPLPGSESFTRSGNPATIPRILLNLGVIVGLLIGTYFAGPKVIDLIKEYAPVIATSISSAYTALRNKDWHTEVRELFNEQNLSIPLTVDSEVEETEQVLITEIQTTEQDIKDYIDGKVYRPWY